MRRGISVEDSHRFAPFAAYRDRYKLTSDLPLGGGAKNDAQRADRQRALAALRSVRAPGASERATGSFSMEVRAIQAP